MKVKKDVIFFVVGVALGYCLVQGASYVQQNYLWALFYRW